MAFLFWLLCGGGGRCCILSRGAPRPDPTTTNNTTNNNTNTKTKQKVAYEFGVNTHNALKELGVAVELKSYPGMAHGACPEELAAVKAFIKARVP